MHTQNLDKEVLHSLPIEVHFAGFRSNTLALAKAGWDLSMRQEHSIYGAEYEMQLILRHDGCKLYAASHRLIIDHRDLYRVMSEPVRMGEFISNQTFHIQYVAPGIQYQMMSGPNMSHVAFQNSFKAVDPFPQMANIDVKDFKFFRVANPSIKDIVVTAELVPEILEMVLKAQAPGQAEIRRRMESRANYSKYQAGSSEYGSVKPFHEVQAQIITLAS